MSESPSISIASREAKCDIADTIAGAQFFALEHFKNTPSSITGAPQAGQTAGFTTSTDSSVCSAIPNISGMTSLLRRIKTLLFIFISLRRISLIFDSVALLTVTPARSTGSSTAKGFSLPVLDTCHMTSRKVVVTSCAGNLYATAHLGNFSVYPISSRIDVSSTLTTAPSMRKSRLSLFCCMPSSAAINLSLSSKSSNFSLTLNLLRFKKSIISLPEAKSSSM